MERRRPNRELKNSEDVQDALTTLCLVCVSPFLTSADDSLVTTSVVSVPSSYLVRMETTEVVTSESSAEVKNGETQTKQRVEKL
jgi:hypothetical protein